MNSSNIINYNTLKNMDNYNTTLLKGYIDSNDRPKYITDMITGDEYPMDRIFIFNN